MSVFTFDPAAKVWPPPARVCGLPACDLEALPGKRRCYEDWLTKQPPIVRVEAAERRLALVPPGARRARVKAADCPPGRRWCAGCQTMVRNVDAANSRCKACSSIAAHTSRIKSEFGIDALTYAWVLERQGGLCGMCRQPPRTVRLAVDHDHTMPCATGPAAEHDSKRGCVKCIRGLLCSRCNGELLAAALHSVHVLENAVAYMTHPPFRDEEWTIPQVELDAWHAAAGPDCGDVPPF